MQTVVVVGHINWDITLVVEEIPPADGETQVLETYEGPGGSAANVAVGLAELGISSRLVGSVGNDEYGKRAQEYLDERGVDTTAVRIIDGVTTRKHLLVTTAGTVRVLGHDGVNEATGPDEIDGEILAGADHLHVTNHRTETQQKLLTAANERGLSVSLDLGRQGAINARTTLVERADLVFGTESELAALFDEPQRAATENRTIVCTQGAQGASVHTAETTLQHPGTEHEPVDTSGAGDAFVAGFLKRWLTRDSLQTALVVGNACGGYASTRRGTQLSLDAAEIPAESHEQS